MENTMMDRKIQNNFADDSSNYVQTLDRHLLMQFFSSRGNPLQSMSPERSTQELAWGLDGIVDMPEQKGIFRWDAEIPDSTARSYILRSREDQYQGELSIKISNDKAGGLHWSFWYTLVNDSAPLDMDIVESVSNARSTVAHFNSWHDQFLKDRAAYNEGQARGDADFTKASELHQPSTEEVDYLNSPDSYSDFREKP